MDSIDEALFGTAPPNVRAEDCDFYHVMDLPGHGLTPGQWDLRPDVETYLGGIDFAGKRVLEVGPASGFLTFEMERRGADVVCFEVSEEIGWDFVPYPAAVLEPMLPDVRRHLTRIKNSWWFTRQAHGGKARIHYGSVYAMPDGLGRFDVGLLAAVLTHTRSPVAILEQCARRCETIVITEPYEARLDGLPVCRLNPVREPVDMGTWWYCSPEFYRQYLDVMGYDVSEPVVMTPNFHGVAGPMYTIVGRRRPRSA